MSLNERDAQRVVCGAAPATAASCFSRAGSRAIALLLGLMVGSALAQTAVSITPPNLSGPVAGSLAGSASVTPTGASHYTVAIAVPPGTAGMAPSVSLDYGSQSGMGLLGLGWSISGMSQITRCGKSILPDGVRTVVKLNSADQFCLDGQRLRLVSGTHGASAEYRTQVETFSQVTSTGSDPNKGPDTWTVRTKSGLIYTYGTTTDSPNATVPAQGNATGVILKWALSRVSDRRGNYYSYVYSSDTTTGEFYPTQILYTGNTVSRLAPYNTINFLYEDRPDPWTGYTAGSQQARFKRLIGIQTRINTDANGRGGALVRDYRIAYTANPTSGRSLVDNIKDCDAAGNCLPATQFTWTTWASSANTFYAAGSGNWGGPAVVFNSDYARYGDKGQQTASQVLAIDIDGDGKADLVRSDGFGTWKVCLSTGASFACTDWSGPAAGSSGVLPGDFQGIGRTQLAVRPSAAGIGNWQICSFTASAGFNCATWAGRGTGGKVSTYAVVDVDGDGRDDIVMTASGVDYLCRSLGNAFATDAQGSPCGGAYDGVQDALTADIEAGGYYRPFHVTGDFFGDGRTGMASAQGGGIVHATETAMVWGTLPDVGSSAAIQSVSIPGHSITADIDGDGYTDYVSSALMSGNVWAMHVCRSTGVSKNCSVINGMDMNGVGWVADTDGDGRPEVLTGHGVCQIGERGPYQFGTTMGGGVNVVCQPWTPPQGGSNAGSVAGDFNGDGRNDVASYDEPTGTWWVSLHGDGGVSSLLSSVVDGIGKQVQFDYSGLNNISVYTKGAEETYPKRTLMQGRPVVSEMRVSNAQGGWLTTDYKYESLRSHLTGYGSLGFAKVTSIDQVNGLSTVTTYSQDFPTIGMPLTVTVKQATQPANCVLSTTSNTLTSMDTAGGAKYPYVLSSTVSTQDLNCKPLTNTTTNIGANGVDSYGNVTNTTTTVDADGDRFTTTTTNVYDQTISSWPFNLLGKTSVTKGTVLATSGASPAALTLSGCTSNSPTAWPTPASTSCTLGNVGQTAAASIAYSASGAAASGPGSCAAGTANCGVVTVSLAATTTWAGNLTATPSVGTPASVPISLTVNGSAASVQTSANFGSNAYGVAIANQSVIVKNAGNTPMTLSVSGLASPFSLVSNGCSNVAANATCNITFAMASNAIGTASQTITLSGATTGSVIASLSGTVTGSIATVQANAAFGSNTYGASIANQSVTVKNTGNAPMTLSVSGYSSPFSLVSNGCSNVAANATCNVTFAMANNVIGTANQTITLSGGPTGNVTASVSGTVTGSTAVVQANAAFGSNAYGTTIANQSVTVKNTGNAAMTLSVSGYSSPFSLVSNGCSNVAANATCNVTFAMANNVIGTANQTITLSGGSTGNVTASVSGTVTGSRAVVQANAAFGSNAYGATIGNQSVTVQNTGNAAMTLSVSGYGSPFSLVSNGCSNVAANGTCSITFSMANNVIGVASQAISLSGASAGTVNASVSGTVTGSVATLIAGDLTFGSLAHNSGNQTRTLTFRNDGAGAAMTISSLYGFPTQTWSPFSVGATTCSSIPVGQTCTVQVSMSTGTFGSWSGYSVFPIGPTVNGGGIPTPASGSVNGTISTLMNSASQTFVSAMQNSTAPQVKWTFHNDGNQPMTLSLSPLNLPFSLVSNGCSNVGPGNICDIVVQMATGTVGNFSQAGIAVSGAAEGSRSDLGLSGTVTASNTTVSVSPSPAAFGTVAKQIIRTVTVTLNNATSAPATALAYGISYTSGTASQGGYYFGSGGTCPAAGGSLAGNSSCTVNIVYEASCTSGGRNGTFTVSGANFTKIVTTLTATTGTTGVCN